MVPLCFSAYHLHLAEVLHVCVWGGGGVSEGRESVCVCMCVCVRERGE